MAAQGSGEHDEAAWLGRDLVARQALMRPGKLAAREFATGRSVTFGELETELRRCEAWLRKTLSGPGARVAILARNSIRHFTLFYACPRAGAAITPLNWRLSGAELAVVLDDARPEILIYDAEFEAEAETALASVPVPKILRIGADGDAFAEALGEPVSAPGRIDPNAPSMLLYTSGTTGKPKGVIHTPKTCYFAGLNFTQVSELTPQSVLLCDAPLFHVVGLLAIMQGAMFVGATVEIADRFVSSATLSRLTDPVLAVSHYFAVPQMLQAVIDEPGFAAAELSNLRVFSGGGPMPAACTLALLDRGVRASNGFGMSENGTLMHVPLDIETARRKVGSVGVPTPVLELRLVDSEGRDVADGETGEFWVRGPTVTPGYWNQPEATARAFAPGGWFRTGDAGRREADGFYSIVDRWKDMYITGGENVYPAEVEAALLQMAAVAEAAVIGVADARWGEAGCAFVVRRSGQACEPADVVAWCEAKLARYKRPAHVRFVQSLPRTASGKVQKDILRRAFAETPTETSS